MPIDKAYLPEGVRARIWRRRDRRRFEAGPKQHAELVVLVGLEGTIQYYIDGTIARIEPRTALFAQPGRSHFLVSETRHADLIVVVVSQSLRLSGDIHSVSTDASGTTEDGIAKISRSDFEELIRLSHRLVGLEDQAVIEIGISWWLCEVQRMVRETETRLSSSLHPKVGDALELIHETPSMAISQIADAVGLSHTRLTQLFRRDLGCSPSAVRLDRRLALVEELRDARPEASLLELSLDAGFGDYSSFYRAYQKRYGHKPRHK
ncbi:MAG: helix-turn-helix domain-containing protein [Paracoccaceae bacterium]